MQIIDLLMRQHEEVKTLFRTIEKAADREEAENVLVQIVDKLQTHATIEEKIFYPDLEASGGDSEEVKHAYQEHAEVKAMIEQILSDPPEPELKALVKTLIAAVEKHVEEEESELFEEARNALNHKQMEQDFKRARSLQSQLNNGDAAPV